MLAVDGGTPVRTTPFPKRALFGDQERAAAMALFDHFHGGLVWVATLVVLSIVGGAKARARKDEAMN